MVNLDQIRHLAIGTVEFVSPVDIKVILETDAPQSTAINTGVPSLFPRINGFVLIPNEVGALVGIINWLGVENSQYPKRKGYKDFDLIDLPFPLRKMSINPVGTLTTDHINTKSTYKLERGVYSFPSIGDSVVLPTSEQLKAIVENDDDQAFVKIGVAPIADNASVKINPDKLFGRHVAVLGNTGSGKSCSVAGLIRWSLEEAQKRNQTTNPLNARFVVLDPNGEYSDSFQNLNTEVKVFKVELKVGEAEYLKQLKVPAWLWNSYEWSSFAQASGKTQRPILVKTLRELKSGGISATENNFQKARRFINSCHTSILHDLAIGSSSIADKPGRNDFGKRLQSYSNSIRSFVDSCELEINSCLESLADHIENIAKSKFKTYQSTEYYESFNAAEAQSCIDALKAFLDQFGGIASYEGPNEDAPINFDSEQLPSHLELVANQQGVLPFLDFLIMRIRTMLSDARMNSIIGSDDSLTLEQWLENHLKGIVVIDLSLVPADVVHLVVAVASRVIFEALQRYRRQNARVLPTVLVLEEAHNFIKRGYEKSEEISATEICNQIYERIAREGRKFGLSLMISSQRPSELSATILSQCNTFLLHRIVNDRDQELISRLVPDNVGGLLKELPVLPSRKAILLGWASSIPILVEINELEKKYRPKSDDPDFWNVWTGNESRDVDWNSIAAEWQGTKQETAPTNGAEETADIPA
ncbi:ATP-binding protein [Adhaeribacter soli]|uniref:ATP-binding protein n=1 Tax=Adhaeribacter soli TaxID=2607655 RepID=A0A5N1IXX1_9BACT|nr:ATP-binding protein [Adhaeribacter soli]KAA9338958.1 ATP-binding protein [Adhaeribacter soli]